MKKVIFIYFLILFSCKSEYNSNEFVEYKGFLVDTNGNPLSNISLELLTNDLDLVNEVVTQNDGTFSIVSPSLNDARLVNSSYIFRYFSEEENMEIESFGIIFMPEPIDQISNINEVKAHENEN